MLLSERLVARNRGFPDVDVVDRHQARAHVAGDPDAPLEDRHSRRMGEEADLLAVLAGAAEERAEAGSVPDASLMLVLAEVLAQYRL